MENIGDRLQSPEMIKKSLELIGILLGMIEDIG